MLIHEDNGHANENLRQPPNPRRLVAHSRARQVGLTFAPGKHAWSKEGPRWERDLAQDLDRLRHHHAATHLVCLLQDAELSSLLIPTLIEDAEKIGLKVRRLPIPDGGVLPDPQPVRDLVQFIRREQAAEGHLVIHCAGGLGRAGTVAGCLLVESGLSAQEALATLQRVRALNCPETQAQRNFISLYWKSP